MADGPAEGVAAALHQAMGNMEAAEVHSAGSGTPRSAAGSQAAGSQAGGSQAAGSQAASALTARGGNAVADLLISNGVKVSPVIFTLTPDSVLQNYSQPASVLSSYFLCFPSFGVAWFITFFFSIESRRKFVWWCCVASEAIDHSSIVLQHAVQPP